MVTSGWYDHQNRQAKQDTCAGQDASERLYKRRLRWLVGKPTFLRRSAAGTCTIFDAADVDADHVADGRIGVRDDDAIAVITAVTAVEDTVTAAAYSRTRVGVVAEVAARAAAVVVHGLRRSGSKRHRPISRFD